MPELSVTVDRRLEAAGFTPDDPALVALRTWNRQAAGRQSISVETRRGQFGKTRPARLDEVTTSDN